MIRLLALFGKFWSRLKDATGESDYARYRSRIGRDEPLMTPREFYLWRLEKKYSGIHRCC